MAKLSTMDVKVREIMNQGNEPAFSQLDYTREGFSTEYMRALNWIHNTVEPEVLRGELETLLVNRKAEADVPYIADLDGVTQSTLGKIAYCVNRGAQLAPTSILRIRKALDEVRGKTTAATLEVRDDMLQEQTAAGKVNEAYKACYSRIDNVKARFLNGKTELTAVKDEVRAVLAANGGDRVQVRKRLVEHYTQMLQEAMQDKVLKTWVAPLQEILKALGGDVKAIKVKVQKISNKVATKTSKVTKGKVRATRTTKAKTKGTKMITMKPKREAGKPSTASQVRDLIRAHKVKVDEKGMVEIVIRELGLSKERGRSVVKAFWNKVGA
jgi:hypothetical protein